LYISTWRGSFLFHFFFPFIIIIFSFVMYGGVILMAIIPWFEVLLTLPRKKKKLSRAEK
jgi:uncharacterized integral membrane protein